MLQHDRLLPSVTTLIAGEPIRGSWWGHARGQQIYELLGRLEQGEGRLAVKLVAGKLTYLHRALWPSFLRLASAAVAERELSTAARKLFAQVEARGQLRLDRLAETRATSRKELGAAARELELALVAHADSVHTESGAHQKILRSWSDWKKEHAPRIELPTLAAARRELGAAADRLYAGSGRAPRIALLAR